MDSGGQQFSVKAEDGYIHLKTWGPLDENRLDEPADAALALAKEKHIDKLVDDIREIDSSALSIPMQAKAMGILWKLRSFQKVAIVMGQSRVRTLFFSTVDTLHLDRESKFKGFDSLEEAIAWLHDAN
ncbi:MAG TPA: STAS/SEC14 domain-containing protein [Candidatus Saccharimonadales bacterium]